MRKEKSVVVECSIGWNGLLYTSIACCLCHIGVLTLFGSKLDMIRSAALVADRFCNTSLALKAHLSTTYLMLILGKKLVSTDFPQLV